MSWWSDRWRDVRRGVSQFGKSDLGKFAGAAALGYPFLGSGVKAGIGHFLKSSMIKNIMQRYATSYLANKALGRPHADKGALSASNAAVEL